MLALDNEYSGFAVVPAHYIAFAERKNARPCRQLAADRVLDAVERADAFDGFGLDDL